MTNPRDNGLQENQPYIFVSYAHVDREQVYPYIEALRQQGFRIWWDEQIKPGESWVESVADAIADASAILLFVTEGVALSDHCFQEIHFAQSEKKHTVASILDAVELPNRMRFLLSLVPTVVSANGVDERLTQALPQSVNDEIEAADQFPHLVTSLADGKQDEACPRLAR